MSAPPATSPGFERFIDGRRPSAAPAATCVSPSCPKGYDVAIGIFQVRQIDQAFTMGEWGAALGSQFWGTGIFEAAATLLFDFLFDKLGLHRLEARAAVQNGRANGAARKVGVGARGRRPSGHGLPGPGPRPVDVVAPCEDWRQSRTDEQPVVH